MCDYCTKMTSLHYKKGEPIEEVYIEPDKTLTIAHTDDYFSISIKINYCPMCGVNVG